MGIDDSVGEVLDYLDANGLAEDTLVIYITLVILLWNLAVLSLIFKRAFDISTHISAMIAFNYFIAYQFIVYRFY